MLSLRLHFQSPDRASPVDSLCVCVRTMRYGSPWNEELRTGGGEDKMAPHDDLNTHSQGPGVQFAQWRYTVLGVFLTGDCENKMG